MPRTIPPEPIKRTCAIFLRTDGTGSSSTLRLRSRGRTLGKRVGSGCGELDSLIGRCGTMLDGFLMGWDYMGWYATA